MRHVQGAERLGPKRWKNSVLVEKRGRLLATLRQALPNSTRVFDTPASYAASCSGASTVRIVMAAIRCRITSSSASN